MSDQSIINGPRSFSGTSITLQELIALRKTALQQKQISIKKKLFLPGQKETTIRGRGIEFDATREYQPGDDIRSMAWRVTARSLKPHIKIYREEKERPVWLAIDLSPSLYFGTRSCFKSVKSIMQATLTGWSSLLKHERIGALIINPVQKPLVFQPKSSQKSYLEILNSLALSSSCQPAFNNKQCLHHLLLLLQQHVRFGNLIYIYSDFMQFDAETEKLILYITERAQVILNFIYDPFEATPPPPYQYILTDGQQKMIFNMRDKRNRENYQQLFQTKVQQLKKFASKHQITLKIYCTDQKKQEIG